MVKSSGNSSYLFIYVFIHYYYYNFFLLIHLGINGRTLSSISALHMPSPNGPSSRLKKMPGKRTPRTPLGVGFTHPLPLYPPPPHTHTTGDDSSSFPTRLFFFSFLLIYFRQSYFCFHMYAAVTNWCVLSQTLMHIADRDLLYEYSRS